MRKFAVWVFDEDVFLAGQTAAKAAGLPMSQWVTKVMREAVGNPNGIGTTAERMPDDAVVTGPRAPVTRKAVVVPSTPVLPRCRCGHSVAAHLVKGEPGRCQHLSCVPNGCRGYQEAV